MNLAQQVLGAFESGREFRRQNDQRSALQRAQEMAQAGNFQGAQFETLGQGLLGESQAFGQLGEQQRARDTQARLGQAFKNGGWQGAAAAAGEAGEFDFALQATQAASAMNAEQREQYAQSMQWIGGVAGSLKDVPFDQREAMARQVLGPMIESGMFGQSGLDFNTLRYDDQALDLYMNAMVSAADQIRMRREDAQLADERAFREAEVNREQSNWDKSFGLQERELTARREDAASRMGVTRQQAFVQERQLRDDFTSAIKPAEDGLRTLATVSQLLPQINGKGEWTGVDRSVQRNMDAALLTTVARMLQSGVLTDQDIALTSGAGLDSTVQGLLSFAMGGGALAARQRLALKQIAGMRAGALQNHVASLTQEYSDLATQYGLDPSRVVLGRGGAAESAAPSPSSGVPNSVLQPVDTSKWLDGWGSD